MWSAGGGQEASNQWTDRSERSNSVGWGNDKGKFLVEGGGDYILKNNVENFRNCLFVYV